MCYSLAFFYLEKRWKILQSHFFSWRNAGKFCKSIFSVGETPENFAEAFFIFEKCQHKLQKLNLCLRFGITWCHR